ncbi:hypothetical protein [Alteromonas sp. C1M14]|uniref:hypothetical protein n=1 Tax=Alteromonas sp. C1M14 TaxID=2841567 RepID=UPI001C0A025A|nr:hypothetical protein [Alteromonas sp. C1M14]MBU2978798.1 hypothetical protein [Alteromonas sp. C1M14]
MSIRQVICKLLTIAFTNLAFASQEGAEVFQTFSINTAAVSVKGESNENLINSLIVTAFGDTHQLSKGQLAELDGLSINGIQISGETGYPSLGGETVYIKLFMGFTSGIAKYKYIVVSKENGLSIKNI